MSLQKKLNCWKEQNFITAAQCEQILTFERQRSGNTFWRTAFIIAGILIGLGVCLLVAANWDTLGAITKITGAFILLGGLFYTTWWCVVQQKKGLSELFAILSFLMIGATIGLIGQVFNLEGGWKSFAMAWALLGLPFVIISRSLFFNMGWICLFCSSLKFVQLEILLDTLWEDLPNATLCVIGLCLLSYAGNKLDQAVHSRTMLPKSFEKLTLWTTYLCIWLIGLHWGCWRWSDRSFLMALLANLLVFTFFALRMFLAIKTQNISSFRRNAIALEVYIFVLFASAFGNLFLSGVGFILAGGVILAMIYVFRRTARYIKTMEVFK